MTRRARRSRRAASGQSKLQFPLSGHELRTDHHALADRHRRRFPPYRGRRNQALARRSKLRIAGGEISLEEMWRMVDRIRSASRDMHSSLPLNGQLIAHGNSEREAAGCPRRQPCDPAARPPRARPAQRQAGFARIHQRQRRADARRRRAARAAGLDGHGRAAAQRSLRRRRPAHATARLHHRPCAARHGRLSATFWAVVHPADFRADAGHARRRRRTARRARQITSSDEFKQLGDAFNGMADKLVELTEDVRKKERQAMFGRMAAGLVHDLSHPVQNIGNSCKLMVRVFDDLEYRADVHAHDRPRDRHAQARARRPAHRRAARSRRALPSRRQPIGGRHRRVDARLADESGILSNRDSRPSRSSSKATCSRSGVFIATSSRTRFRLHSPAAA